MTVNHSKNIMHEKDSAHSERHGINYKKLASAEKDISNPVMVISSHKNDGTIMIVTSQVDEDGLPIVFIMKPNGVGQINMVDVATNAILSAYGRSSFGGYMSDAYMNERGLYFDKKVSAVEIKPWGTIPQRCSNC